MVLSPDIAQRLAVSQQSRRAIIIRSAALFDQRKWQQTFSNDHFKSATRVEASGTHASRVSH